MAENHDDEQSFIRRYLPYLIVAVIVVVGGVIGAFFYFQKNGFVFGAKSTDSQENVSKIVNTVGKLIELPSDETPTVATVSDVTKLNGQQFFSRAQNGDQVLIYKNAKKAILYRPATNKIVEVGPVNLAPDQVGSQSATPQGSVTPTQVKVVILNGTSTSGLTKKAEDQLVAGDATISVIDRDNASRQDFDKTVVVDLTGKNVAKASAIATAVGGKVESLPSGESKPDADILIILGSPYAEK